MGGGGSGREAVHKRRCYLVHACEIMKLTEDGV